ncbi:MAG: InlB B-repeat-containing protein [Bacteroides sp.]|nr:InlB B-repeat-containing protein [Bacteroides sp.]
MAVFLACHSYLFSLTVTYIPSANDVSILNTKNGVIQVGDGLNVFNLYSVAAATNTTNFKLAYKNDAFTFTDNNFQKSGVAIFIPNSSNKVIDIRFYCYTTKNRKIYYGSGATCPTGGTVSAEALATSATAYSFFDTYQNGYYYCCGGKSGGSGDSYITKIEVDFAKIAQTFTVSFDANGHGAAPAAITDIESGSTITMPADPAANGFLFEGWYTSADCTTPWNFTTDVVTSDITLYAKWTEIQASAYCISIYNSDAEQIYSFIKGEGDNEYIITDFTVPAFSAAPNYWVGENGNWSSTYSANADFADMPLTTNPSTLKVGNAAGALGTLHIWDDNKASGSNLWIKFTPKGYGLCWGVGTWNPDNYLSFSTTDGVTYTTNLVTLSAEQLSSWQYYVGYQTADGYVYTSANSETNYMKDMGVYANNAWWSGNAGQFFVAGQRGIFRMWVDNADTKNWQCHFVPYFGLQFKANYPADAVETAPADTYSDFVSVEESKTIIIPEAPAAPSGYIFKGWTVAQDGTSDLLTPGGEYNLNHPSAPTILYAQWEEIVEPACVTSVWYAYSGDVPTGYSNSTRFTFSGSATGTSNQSCTMTIDGVTYSSTKRGSSYSGSFTFEVGENKMATLYLCIKRGGTDRVLFATKQNSDGTEDTIKLTLSESSFHTYEIAELTSGEWTVNCGNSGKTSGQSYQIAMLGLHECLTAETPTIITQPQSATYCGAHLTMETLGVVASVMDGGSLSYQWYKDNHPIDKATVATYQPTEAGHYYCIVTNTKKNTEPAFVATDIANIVLATAPASVTIVGLPAECNIGDTYPLTATADADGVEYQWYRNDTPIEGATESTYTFIPQQADQLQTVTFTCAAIGCNGQVVMSEPYTTTVYLNTCYYITENKTLAKDDGYDFGDFVLYTDGNKDGKYNTSTSQICTPAKYRYYTTGVTIYLKNYSISALRLQGQQGYQLDIANVEIADALDGVYTPLADYTPVNYTTPNECGELGIADVQIPQGKYVHITFEGSAGEFRISGLCVEGLTCRMPELSWEHSAYEAPFGQDFTAPLLNNPADLPITYASSDTSVATIDADGNLTMVGMGETTISAIYAGDDASNTCPLTASYTLTVLCGDERPLISPSEGVVDCRTVILSLMHADGTTPVTAGAVQWYRNDQLIPGATAYTYIADAEGRYTATLTLHCQQTSANVAELTNSILPPAAIALAPFRTHQIVNRTVRPYNKETHYPLFAILPQGNVNGEQYRFSMEVRNGMDNVKYTTSDFVQLPWVREDNIADDGTIRLGADYPELSNWIGQQTSFTPAVGDTIWLTVHPANACGEFDNNVTAAIPIKLTDRYSIAYIITGPVNGGFYDVNTANLGNFYSQFREKYYEITPVNAYANYDYANFEPYDLVLLTDYPKVTGSNSYPALVDALADLVDKKPMLSFKAHMAASGLNQWKGKGFIKNAVAPSTAQLKMDVLCFAHAIFGDDSFDEGTDHVITLLTNTTDKKGLQGFPELSTDGFVNIATISDGTAEGRLVACCERQVNVEARLLVLSLYSLSTQYISEEGMKAVDKALEYLLQTDPVMVSDCSLIFDNGTTTGRSGSGDHLWSNPANWVNNTLPSRLQNVRIEADCRVSGEDLQIVSNVLVNEYCQLTIAPDGKLGSIGKFSVYKDGNHTQLSGISDPKYIIIESDQTGTGALLHTHTSHPLVATVQLYSPAYIEMSGTQKKPYWSYVAIPVQTAPIPQFFNGAYTYQWDETNSKGWLRYGNGMTMTAFSGCALSQTNPQTFTLMGNLAIAENHEFNLTKSACEGINIIGNSWTAPIQITLLDATDFGEGLEQTVYIYNTGRDATPGVGVAGDYGDNTPGQWRAIPIQTAKLEGYDGPKTIPAMQAFEIDFLPDATQTTATLTIDYNRVVRTSSGTDFNRPLYAPKRATATNQPQLMRISVEDSNTKANLYLLQDEQFSYAFDNGWDGRYVPGDGRSADLWAFTTAGDMAVSAQPQLSGTNLGFAPGRESVYTFSFAWSGETLYLNDILLQRSTRIQTGNTYTFTAFDSEPANRFVISSEPYSPVGTSLADVVLTDAGLILSNPAAESLGVRVYDAAGRLCAMYQTADTRVQIQIPATQGVYMIDVRGNNGERVYKVVR